MFYSANEDGYHPVLPGIRLKTMVHGAKTLFAEFRLEKGSALPKHAHPHEQTGYLVRGRMRLAIGGEAFEVHPGDSWCIPGGIEHGADALEESVAVEVFSPVREDYLAEQGPRHRTEA